MNPTSLVAPATKAQNVYTAMDSKISHNNKNRDGIIKYDIPIVRIPYACELQPTRGI